MYTVTNLNILDIKRQYANWLFETEGIVIGIPA